MDTFSRTFFCLRFYKTTIVNSWRNRERRYTLEEALVNILNPGSDSELSELEDEGDEQDGNVVNIDPEHLEDMILEKKKICYKRFS